METLFAITVGLVFGAIVTAIATQYFELDLPTFF